MLSEGIEGAATLAKYSQPACKRRQNV